MFALKKEPLDRKPYRHMFTPAELSALTPTQRHRLSYLYYLDAFDDDDTEDNDTAIWTPKEILRHQVFRDRQGNRRVRVLASWHMQHNSWINPYGLQIDSPRTVIRYVISKDLFGTPISAGSRALSTQRHG